MGQKNSVLDGVQIPHVSGNFDGEWSSPLWSKGTLPTAAQKNAEVIDIPFRNQNINPGRTKEACIRWEVQIPTRDGTILRGV